MYSVNGQYHDGKDGTPNSASDFNFFAKDFTNHHVGPATTTAVKAVDYKFTSATPWTQSVGLSDCAKYD